MGIRPGAYALLLAVLASDAAFASDGGIEPQRPSTPVLVTTPDAEATYFVLSRGETLEFDTPGPAKLLVEIRRRLPTAGLTPSPAVVEALGDGQRILSIEVRQGPVTGGAIFDAAGGVPTEADRARITVPAGGSVFALRAPADADFLVRVDSTDDDGAVAVAPTPEPAPREPLAQIAPDAPDSAVLSERVLLDEPSSQGSWPPRLVDELSWWVGPRLGLGVPARGDRAVFSYGLQGRVSVLEDLLDATMTVSSYRIGVDTTVVVSDPYAGNSTRELAWHTSVVPVTVDGLVRIPFELGPARPVAGVGTGLYFSRRNDGQTRTPGVSVGTQWSGGADIELGPGLLNAVLAWNGARKQFGNVGADGAEVGETLATTRLETSYLVTF